MDTLNEGAESRNVGGIAKKTTERLVVEAPTRNALATPARESERKTRRRRRRKNEKSGDHVQK